MVFWVQEKARLIKVRNYWWVEQTDGQQTLPQLQEVSVWFALSAVRTCCSRFPS